MFYKIFVYPFVYAIEKVYIAIYSFTSDYGISLLLLSLITSIVIFFLNKLFAIYPERERRIQEILVPQIARIKHESSGFERHARIKALYKRYSYNPIFAFRAIIPFIIQLPFLLAAYFMLSGLEALQGVSFLVIRDLSAPDRLAAGINLLPIAMTTVNALSALISPQLSKRDKVQALFVALVFLVLLYNASSALLIYWTMNNVLFFAQILFARIRPGGEVRNSKTTTRG